MKHLFLKLICLTLCLLFAVGSVGCGKKDNTERDNGEISMFKWDFSSLNSARRSNSPIYSVVKGKAHGYELKSETCGYGDWESTINNLYNTGNLPDVFIHYAVDRPDTFKKMIKNGSVLNYADYITQASHPNLYKRLHEYDWLVERVDYLKGGYYFLPITIKQTHVMCVRKDWIDNLNDKLANILVAEGIVLSASAMTEALYEQYKFVLPQTLTEFYRLAKAFTIYDPDNNGKNDTYGYTCSGNLMWYNNWVFEAMGNTYWGWVPDGSGSYSASWVTEENKNAVAFLNKLYEEGIMDPDYTAMTDATKIQNFCSNRTGIMVDNIYYNTYVEQLRAANNLTTEQAEAAIAVIAPPKGENGTYGLRGNPGFWCGTCINADISRNKIGAILDMLEFMLSEEGYDTFTYGVEGMHYKVENGEKVSLMGQDSNGYNFTAKAKDTAFDLHMFVDWSLNYNPGFSTNYEKVNAYMEMAEEYSYIDDYSYIQTPLVIENWDNIGKESYEYFIRLISTNYGNDAYNRSTIGNADWDSIKVSASKYNDDWSKFVNTFLNSWQGNSMIQEYAAEAAKYKK